MQPQGLNILIVNGALKKRESFCRRDCIQQNPSFPWRSTICPGALAGFVLTPGQAVESEGVGRHRLEGIRAESSVAVDGIVGSWAWADNLGPDAPSYRFFSSPSLLCLSSHPGVKSVRI